MSQQEVKLVMLMNVVNVGLQETQRNFIAKLEELENSLEREKNKIRYMAAVPMIGMPNGVKRPEEDEVTVQMESEEVSDAIIDADLDDSEESIERV